MESSGKKEKRSMENQQLSMRIHAKPFQALTSLLILCFLLLLAGCGHQPPRYEDPYQSEPVYSPNKQYKFTKDPLFSNELAGMGDLYKKQAVITLQINAKNASDTNAASYVRDAIRSQVNHIGDGKIKVLESQTFETDLVLSGEVAMESDATDGQYHVQVTVTDLKVTNLYQSRQNNPRVALISASTIYSKQRAEDPSLALQMATTDVIVRLKHQRFFYRMNQDPIINQLKKEHILFRMPYSKSALQQLEDRLTFKLLAIFHEVAGVKERIGDLSAKMDHMGYEMNQGVAEQLIQFKENMSGSMKNLHSRLRNDVKKLIQDLPSKQIIREKEVIRQIPESALEKITYRQATGVIIKVTSGRFTYVPTSSIVAEGGFEFEFPHQKEFMKKSDITKEVTNRWGHTPFQIKASAKDNKIIISEADASKIYRLVEYEPGVLKNPGVLVIY